MNGTGGLIAHTGDEDGLVCEPRLLGRFAQATHRLIRAGLLRVMSLMLAPG